MTQASFEPMPSPARPPGNLSDLSRRIARYARDSNLTVDRVGQRIASEVFLALLEKAKSRTIIPMYLLKGGMAMELRFGALARASKDVDVGIIAPPEQLLDVLDRIFELDFADFTFRRKRVTELADVRTLRIGIQISYKGRAFRTLFVDINEASHETASDILTTSVLTSLGLPGPLNVPVLNSYEQIAQKLHGASEPSRADYMNMRYRDLLDVLIFRQREKLIDRLRMRTIAREVFLARQHNRTWPPTFHIPEAWKAGLEAEAMALGLEATSAEALEREFLSFIAWIEGCDVKPGYEYQVLRLQRNISGNAEPLDAAARERLDELTANGWRALHFAPDAHFTDQFLLVMERGPLDTAHLPRLQMRMETFQNGEQFSLVGTLRNESDNPADKVRVFMTDSDKLVRLGTITRGDGELHVQLRYDDEPALMRRVGFQSVFVEYLTDNNERVQQIGPLDAYGPDASGRYRYAVLGLGPPQTIAEFHHKHDALDDL